MGDGLEKSGQYGDRIIDSAQKVERTGDNPVDRIPSFENHHKTGRDDPQAAETQDGKKEDDQYQQGLGKAEADSKNKPSDDQINKDVERRVDEVPEREIDHN